MSACFQRKSETELILHVWVTPKSSKDQIDGIETRADGKSYLRLRVRALPEDGKANAAVEKLIAKALDVAPRHVSVIGGHLSRQKQLAISGDWDVLTEKLFAFPNVNKNDMDS